MGIGQLCDHNYIIMLKKTPIKVYSPDFPVKSTWLTAIKSGKFTSWPGLAYVNASKYFPVSVE